MGVKVNYSVVIKENVCNVAHLCISNRLGTTMEVFDMEE